MQQNTPIEESKPIEEKRPHVHTPVQNPNPNKANQHKPDPRQSLFLSLYLDPKSKTFSNAMTSAIKAGYDPDYARQIMGQMPTWLNEKLQNNMLVEKAEKNVATFLDMETINKKLTEDGEVVQFDDAALMRIKADVTKFVLERLAKSKWSVRKEITGEDGTPLLKPHFVVFEEATVDDSQAS